MGLRNESLGHRGSEVEHKSIAGCCRKGCHHSKPYSKQTFYTTQHGTSSPGVLYFSWATPFRERALNSRGMQHGSGRQGNDLLSLFRAKKMQSKELKLQEKRLKLQLKKHFNSKDIKAICYLKSLRVATTVEVSADRQNKHPISNDTSIADPARRTQGGTRSLLVT